MYEMMIGTLREIMKNKLMLSLLLIAVALAGAFTWQVCVARQFDQKVQSVQYTVLDDKLDSRMRIGIQSSVNENQIRAMLVQAADDHQNDRARDLVFGDYFFVEAYLMEGGKTSKKPAGTIRRYVRPKNPDQHHDDWFDWLTSFLGRSDTFWISIDEARRSLK